MERDTCTRKGVNGEDKIKKSQQKAGTRSKEMKWRREG